MILSGSLISCLGVWPEGDTGVQVGSDLEGVVFAARSDTDPVILQYACTQGSDVGRLQFGIPLGQLDIGGGGSLPEDTAILSPNKAKNSAQ